MESSINCWSMTGWRRWQGVALMYLAATAGAGEARAQAPRLVVVTAGDDMKFSVTRIAARRGEVLRIRLNAVGTAPRAAMAHNLIVLRPGSNQIAFVEAAAQAKATDYIPSSLKDQILASTILIANGERAEIEIALPPRAGTYPFLCSFPGHFAGGARGTIVVK
jgi:azurin